MPTAGASFLAATLTLIFAVYTLALIPALLTFGQLSDARTLTERPNDGQPVVAAGAQTAQTAKSGDPGPQDVSGP